MTNDDCRMSNGGILSFYFQVFGSGSVALSKNLLSLKHKDTYRPKASLRVLGAIIRLVRERDYTIKLHLNLRFLN